MADNVTIPATGTGDLTPKVATDDDGTAHHQYVKVEFGADNTQTKVSAANPLPVTAVVSSSPTSTTGTQTSVSGSASNVTLLASNASRKGATLFNDSTANCYVRLAATATTSNFSVKMTAAAYYEVPFGYTGIIDGIWDSATGNMRVTELT